MVHEPEERGTKRRHATGGKQPELERDPVHWYKNGDIVLAVSQETSYKVHSDILGKRSKVFRDLLDSDVPQPHDQETIDGRPVVHLTDDPEDFTIFLGLIYNGWEYRQMHHAPRWSVIRAMIVLGDKYDVPEFREEGINRLKSTFPTDMNDFDAAHNDKSGIGIYYKDNDSISMAAVTRTLNMPDLHAAVLNECCSLPISALLGEDKSQGETDVLCQEDIVRCLCGREGLTDAWFKLHEKLFDTLPLDPFECSCNNACRNSTRRLQRASMNHARRAIVDSHRAYSPLARRVWIDLFSALKKDGVCSPCLKFYEGKLQDLRQEFRNGLSKRFGTDNS